MLFSAATHIFFIGLPIVAEIVTLVIAEEKYKIVLICGFMQIVLAGLGGIMMGKIYENIDNLFISIADFKNLYSPPFVVYVLVPWNETNIMITWILTINGFQLEWFVHFFAYLPIAIYFIGFCAGKTIKN